VISLPITSTIAACLAIVMFVLTLQISIRRKSIGNVVLVNGLANHPITATCH
jgi:hypothetical protein